MSGWGGMSFFPDAAFREPFCQTGRPLRNSPKIRLADFRGLYPPMFIFFLDQQNESAENAAGRGWHLLKP